MSFIGCLNPNDWKPDWTNNDVCYFTWSRDQTHVCSCCERKYAMNTNNNYVYGIECAYLLMLPYALLIYS